MQLSDLESRQQSNYHDFNFRRRSRASVDEPHTKIRGHPSIKDNVRAFFSPSFSLSLSICRVLNDGFAHTQRPVRIRVDVVRDDRVHNDSDYIGISDIFPSVSPNTPVFDEKGDEFMAKQQSG